MRKGLLLPVFVFLIGSCSEPEKKEDIHAEKEKLKQELKDTAAVLSATEEDEIPGYTSKDIDKLPKKLGYDLTANPKFMDSLRVYLEASPELIDYAMKAFGTFQEKTVEKYNMEKSPVAEQWGRMVRFETTDGDYEIVTAFLNKNGATLEQSEGEFYIIPNSSFGNKVFMPFLPEEDQAFYAIEQYANDTKFLEDGGLVVSRMRLADLAAEAEGFIKEYPKTRFDKEINEIFKSYMGMCISGYDNTPTLDYDSNLIREEVISEWEAINKKYNNMQVGAIIRRLLEEIGESRENPPYEFYRELIEKNGL